MCITRRLFGCMPDGEEVSAYTLSNSKGMKAEILDFGGIVVSLHVPDKNGKPDDVVLGFNNLNSYLSDGFYLGAIVGRYANRIKNALFELNGKEYRLYKNDGENHLHGGKKGFDKVLWKAETALQDGAESLKLSYASKDGEEGYPGNLEITVTYTLTEKNALEIDYFAVSDKDTVVNLTNHAYFNLAGHKSGEITGHRLMINADMFTVSDSESIPTGEIRDVEGTPLDFRAMKAIGMDIDKNYEQTVFGKGYDQNWVLNTRGKITEKAAEVFEPSSGRLLEVYTTMPGMQFYTGNYLDGSSIGKEEAVYGRRNGLCLETQYFPDSINHKHFPSPILKAGEKYRHKTIYKFLII